MYYYGSLAYDYDDYVEPSKKNVKRERKKVAAKNFSVLKLFLLLTIMFVGSMVTLYSICLINTKANEIVLLQKKLGDIKSDNVILEEEISKKFDLNETKKIAQTKLGMHTPLPYQIVYIKKPKQNYVIKY